MTQVKIRWRELTIYETVVEVPEEEVEAFIENDKQEIEDALTDLEKEAFDLAFESVEERDVLSAWTV